MLCVVVFFQTATVKELDRSFQKLSQFSGDVDPSRKRKIMAIGKNISISAIFCHSHDGVYEMLCLYSGTECVPKLYCVWCGSSV